MLSRQAARRGGSAMNGFTLIELLAVMVIVGLLTAIAIPIFANAQRSSRESSAKSDVRTIEMAVERLITVQMPTTDVAITGSAGSYSIASTPPTTGQLNPGNVVGTNSKYGPNGVYCVSVGTSDGVYFRTTNTSKVAPGSC